MLKESISETSPLLSMIDLFCLVDGLVSLIVCKSFSDHIHSWLMARVWLLWEILVLAWRPYWSNHTNKEIFQTFNSSNRHIFLSQVIFNHKKIKSIEPTEEEIFKLDRNEILKKTTCTFGLDGWVEKCGFFLCFLPLTWVKKYFVFYWVCLIVSDWNSQNSQQKPASFTMIIFQSVAGMFSIEVYEMFEMFG